MSMFYIVGSFYLLLFKMCIRVGAQTEWIRPIVELKCNPGYLLGSNFLLKHDFFLAKPYKIMTIHQLYG